MESFIGRGIVRMPSGRDKKRAVRGVAGRSIVTRVNITPLSRLVFPFSLAAVVAAMAASAAGAARTGGQRGLARPECFHGDRGDRARARRLSVRSRDLRGRGPAVGRVSRATLERSRPRMRAPARAWDSVKRWRTLAPTDRDAAAVYATVALKLYRVSDARTALATVLKAQSSENDATPGAKQGRCAEGQQGFARPTRRRR